MEWHRQPASFRDPSGFVFTHGGQVLRHVAPSHASAYQRLMQSGLYEALTRSSALIPHEEVEPLPSMPAAHAVLRPERIGFVSYPYEWCFGQLKAAALLTLDVQRESLAREMSLRDASAYNVQFVGARPTFIDTLSFGHYVEGEPWVAYRQYCQHFLNPLALIALADPALGQLTRASIDGIPLPVASRLLPMRSRVRPGLLTHIHLHARAVERAADRANGAAPSRAGMNRTAMLGLIDSLRRTVESLSCTPRVSTWSAYADDCHYSAPADADKARLVHDWLELASHGTRFGCVWDLGANTGRYSRIAAQFAERVIALDGDHASVQRHYDACSARRETQILPLLQDLTNPSGALGWHHAERQSLLQRGPADAALALAVVHHLVISGGVPLDRVAAFLADCCRHLVVEFVPPGDPQVERMLALRKDPIGDYSQDVFERACQTRFDIVRTARVADSGRILYLMVRR